MRLALFSLLTAAALVGGLPLPALATPSPEADYVLTAPAERYFDVDEPMELASGSGAQTIPEPMMDAAGELVLGYMAGVYSTYVTPRLARFNATTGAQVGGEVVFTTGLQYESWANTTARGSFTALNSQSRALRAYWNYGTYPTNYAVIKSTTLDGGAVLPETRIGNTPWATPVVAIAVGANDSVHIVRDNMALLYSRMNANGTWAYRNISLYNDGQAVVAPQVVWDAPAGLAVVSWVSSDGTGRISAVDRNGTVAWGPLNLGRTSPSLSILTMADGSVIALYSYGSSINALKISSAGSVVLSDRTVVASATNAQTPRGITTSAGELLVVWSDQTGAGGGDLEVHAVALDPADFSVTVAASKVSDDKTPSVNARAVAAPDGSVWVVWQNDTSTYTATLWGAKLRPRWSGAEARTPSQDITVYRGERATVGVNFKSLVSDPNDFVLASEVVTSPIQPSNWTAQVVDAVDGSSVSAFPLAAGSERNVSVMIDAPVVDPLGYGAWIVLRLTDVRRPSVELVVVLNATVAAGHRYEVTPTDQNVTAWPGQPANVTFTVRSAGVLDEAGVPVSITVPPPDAAWSARLSSSSFSAPSGGSAVFVLQVTPPLSAMSNQSYCARLRVQHTNDTFATATAGFCVRVALVTAPQVTPGALNLTVDPGSTVIGAWTLQNVGNAAVGIECRLTVVESLPAGWTIVGSPAIRSLAAYASANISFHFGAPSDALGGLRFALTIRGTCNGAAAPMDALLDVTVRTIHSVAWRSAGSTADATPAGAASFTLTLENTGNADEPVVPAVGQAPPGWTVTFALTQSGAPVEFLRAFSAATLTASVLSPEHTLAGSYPIILTLAAGTNAPVNITYTVRIAKAYGLNATFAADPPAVGPNGTVTLRGSFVHLGNTADTYTLHVEIRAPQVWSYRVSYTPENASDPSVFFAATLSLEAFSRGEFRVQFTSPRDPFWGAVAYTVSMTNTRSPAVVYNGEIQIILANLTATLDEVPSGLADPTLHGVFRGRVSNAGVFPAGPFSVQLLVDGAVVGQREFTGLAPGASEALEFEVDLWGGDHVATLVVDPKDSQGGSPVYGQIYESNDQDNSASSAFTIGVPPPEGKSGDQVVTGTGGGAILLVAGVLAIAAVAGLVSALLVMRRRRHTIRLDGGGQSPRLSR